MNEPLEINKSNRQPIFNSPRSTARFFPSKVSSGTTKTSNEIRMLLLV